MKKMSAMFLGLMLLAGRGAAAQQGSRDMLWRQPILDTVDAVLQGKLMLHNKKWYGRFRVTPQPPAPQPQNGFAPLVVPQPAVPPIREGVFEISFEALANANVVAPSGQYPGEVWLKIESYRVYDPARGWVRGAMTMPAWLNWSVVVDNGQLQLHSISDMAQNTGYGELTHYLASVFNVPPQCVSCERP